MPIYIPKIKVRYWCKGEILTIKEYWNLIGWEPFLAVTWEPDFSQACSFGRMLMNHKNFYFTQIPNKTNDVIFLKSPNTMFFGNFRPFLVVFAGWGFFPKNLAVTHNHIWAPKTMLSFRKNSWVNSEKTYRQMKGWMEGQTEGRTLPTNIVKALPRQTEKSWICLGILLPTNLAPQFWRMFFVDHF